MLLQFLTVSGAFLIPYFTMLLLCGIPLLFMEFAIGQYTRLGPVHALAKICPLLKGESLQMQSLLTRHNLYISFHSQVP